MIRFLILFLGIFTLFSQNANACRCALSTPESSREEMEKAYYVGKVEIISIKELENNHIQLRLLAVEPYAKPFYRHIMATARTGVCGFGEVEIGEIHEMVIYRDEKYNLTVKGDCPYILPEIWEEYRKKGSDMKKKMEKDKENCESKGGKWAMYGLTTAPSCILKSSDKDKPCSDSSECEGICIADYTKEQMEFVLTAKPPFNLKVNGKCSEFMTMYGCQHIVQKGYVQYVTCKE